MPWFPGEMEGTRFVAGHTKPVPGFLQVEGREFLGYTVYQHIPCYHYMLDNKHVLNR